MSGTAPNQVKDGSTKDGNDEAWNEERLQDSLDQLDLLHTKARLLRDTVPKLMDPLIQKQQSPDMMVHSFMGAVNQARGDVSKFTQLMTQADNKAILARAEKSRQENPQGIKPWRHKDHPNWFKGTDTPS